jgi:hypothetical protein
LPNTTLQYGATLAALYVPRVEHPKAINERKPIFTTWADGISHDVPLHNSLLVCVRIYPGTLFRAFRDNSLTQLKNLP